MRIYRAWKILFCFLNYQFLSLTIRREKRRVATEGKVKHSGGVLWRLIKKKEKKNVEAKKNL